MRGYLALILHAHLPFVRHPENAFHLEELWLFEALVECYLPLLERLDALAADAVPCRITFSVSPTLLAMLDDPLLRDRFVEHLDRTARLCAQERGRAEGAPALQSLVTMYTERYARLRALYMACDRDILSRFARHHAQGRVELICAAGTHAILPLMHTPQSQRAHIASAVSTFRARFGFSPRGMWLPECAFSPELAPILADLGVQYTILDHHGLMHADDLPLFAASAPITAPCGVSFFGRDQAASRIVWSATEGYPGDYFYREFYRDLGFDLPLDQLRPFIHPDGIRTHTGLKYYRVTGPTSDKALYDPAAASARALVHAQHFVEMRLAQLQGLPETPQPPVIVCPYDAELFGHWWFEGPQFIDHVLRMAATSELEPISLGDYLDRHPTHQQATPGLSSWGEDGYLAVWLDASNDWIYRHLHRAEERMVSLANLFPEARSVRLRALNQAARELMLAQSSDWAFIIHSGTSVGYAIQRLQAHLDHFNRLDAMLLSDRIDLPFLKGLEDRTASLFPDLDYHHFEGPLA
jgi:1,4-alpha-glucan branching enzyme